MEFFHVRLAEITIIMNHNDLYDKLYTCCICIYTYIEREKKNQKLNTGHLIFKFYHYFLSELITVSIGKFS